MISDMQIRASGSPPVSRGIFPRRAITLAEVMVAVTVATVVMGIAMSLLMGLQKWDRNLREHSLRNQHLVRLAETIRGDIRQASEAMSPTTRLLTIRLADGHQASYQLSPDGCRRSSQLAGDTEHTDLFAIGPSEAWSLEQRVGGRRPMYAVTINRTNADNTQGPAPLIVHAALGADMAAHPD
jgi:hypothetical protein